MEEQPIPFQDLRKTNTPGMDAYLEAAERVLRSGRYVNGQEGRLFEDELAQALGVRYCVAVSNGLDALRLILLAFMDMGHLRTGDEVIVPANTFIATFLAVTGRGLKAVPAEVNEADFCLDFSRLPLSPKTRAIIPVHLFGNPCWDEEVIAPLRRKGILVIEDNAQAIGASLMVRGKRRHTGTLGDAAAVSFYPAKNIGAFGDAGAVLTDNPLLAEKVRMLANYGSQTKYAHELCGFNCRMDEIQAALLRVKIPLINEVTRRRSLTASVYQSEISNPAVIKPAIQTDGALQAWHQYVIRHPNRDGLRDFLSRNGVGTEVHYPVPCHRQPCYADVPHIRDASLPVAEKLAKEILSLPIADVNEKEARRISRLINGWKSK